MTNPLQTKAVLADVTIRLWTGRKLDRQVTDEVNQQHHAVADAGRFNKLLVPAEAFSEVYCAARTARILHRSLTQPWFDEGPRLLSLELAADFTKRFSELRQEFENAADEFDKKFPFYVRQRQAELGSMFKAEDYPAKARIRGMFGFNVTMLPVPDVSDFRVKLSKEQLEDTERQLKEALENAMKEPFRRIAHLVGRMSERLNKYKPKSEAGGVQNSFRDSLVGNIRELVDLLPAFNLTKDKTLDELIVRLEKELCAHDATVLREDELVRKQVAKNAEDILKKAQALMA